MEIPHFFLTIEESGLSMWVRDNPFWAILTVHAVGMAMLVGASSIIDLRLLGFASKVPIAPLRRLYGMIWAGFWIQIVSRPSSSDWLSHEVIYESRFLFEVDSHRIRDVRDAEVEDTRVQRPEYERVGHDGEGKDARPFVAVFLAGSRYICPDARLHLYECQLPLLGD
jgi:hypothetical protein